MECVGGKGRTWGLEVDIVGLPFFWAILEALPCEQIFVSDGRGFFVLFLDARMISVWFC